MKMAGTLGFALAISFGCAAAAEEVAQTFANDGNLVMEGVPAIPADIVDGLNRYQNVRSASFRAWTEDGSGIYVATRFADVPQLHRVDIPGGARQQLTFNKEPLGGISRIMSAAFGSPGSMSQMSFEAPLRRVLR